MSGNTSVSESSPDRAKIKGNLQDLCESLDGTLRIVDNNGNPICPPIIVTQDAVTNIIEAPVVPGGLDNGNNLILGGSTIVAIGIVMYTLRNKLRIALKGNRKQVKGASQYHDIEKPGYQLPLSQNQIDVIDITAKGKQELERLFQDTFLTARDWKHEKDKFSVTLVFLSRDTEIDTFIINKLRSAVLGKVLDDNHLRPQILERALWALKTLGFDINNNTRVNNPVETNDPIELEDLIAILKVIKASIELTTPIQSPSVLAPEDTHSSEKMA